MLTSNPCFVLKRLRHEIFQTNEQLRIELSTKDIQIFGNELDIIHLHNISKTTSLFLEMDCYSAHVACSLYSPRH